MSYTASTVKFIPEVHGPLSIKRANERFASFKSGAVSASPLLAQLLAGPNNLIKAPNLKPLEGDSVGFSDNGTALTPGDITHEVGYAGRTYRRRSFGASQLAELIGLGKPSEQIPLYLGDYWAGELNKSYASIMKSYDTLLLTDLTGATVKNLTPQAIYDAQATKGDNLFSLTQLHVHGDVYTQLKKDDLIDYVKPSSGGEIASYAGMRLVVDATLPKVETSPGSGVFNYTSRVLGDGVVKFNAISIPEWAGDVKDLSKGTIENISTNAYAFHLTGTTLTSTGIAALGAAPTGFSNGAYATAANYELLWDATMIPYVAIKHRLVTA